MSIAKTLLGSRGRIALLTAIVLAAALLELGLPASMTDASAAEADGWTKVLQTQPALTLNREPFSREHNGRTSYVHSNGSQSDWLIAGSLALNAPNITLFITRQTKPEPIRYSLIRNLEELSDLKLVPHHYRTSYYVMKTRFGDLRGIPFDVNADGVRKFCVGFHKPDSNRVFLKGFFCSMSETEATPDKVACIIDQIRYSRPEDDLQMKASLAEGEAKPCGAELMTRAANTSSLEDKSL
jgi:hypothetical protein